MLEQANFFDRELLRMGWENRKFRQKVEEDDLTINRQRKGKSLGKNRRFCPKEEEDDLTIILQRKGKSLEKTVGFVPKKKRSELLYRIHEVLNAVCP